MGMMNDASAAGGLRVLQKVRLEPRERFNVVSHVVATVLAAAATVWLVREPIERGETVKALALGVFGLTLTHAYLCSVLFHATRGKMRAHFRQLDRVAIYLMIWGGYAPICLLAIDRRLGWPMLAIVSVITAVGVWRERPRRVPEPDHRVGPYVALGWLALVIVVPLSSRWGISGLGWFLAGGLLYTIGGLIVRRGRLRYAHEIWHVLAMAATTCHFIMVAKFVA